MYNVLLLGSAIDTGGAERVIANLTKYVDRSRFNVMPCHLVRPRGAIGDELVRDGYEVLDVGRSERGIWRYLSFLNLRKIVRERQIHVIHSHTHYALSDASLCSLSMARRVKVLHTFHFGNYPHISQRYRLLEGFGSRAAHRLVAVGIEQAKRVSETFHLPPDSLDVVMNGVEKSTAPIDTEWAERLRATGAVVVGTICTFIEQKGLPDLLAVAQELKRANANVVLRKKTEAQCREMGLTDRVFFTGWKYAASGSMLPLFDIFFQPSLWEAMSMVVLEAMAAGKPVVATNVGDNGHVIVNGETGFLAERRDVPAMVAALRTLIDSADQRRTFGETARRRYADRYTAEQMTRQYERLYLEVLTRRGREADATRARDVNASGIGLGGSEKGVELRCES
jgi:glycosyltransferase involved in cell wall biosynthesis